ncbi:gamma carbonic anhydrase family protein [Fulvivirgaceae bacterium BMA12]|uniref:Gamma carbonic anhydrase family protein n=1 Tax=Agaribacillus aureus TaxID=3051825 RepID=A0ABT8L7W0_9BACT|nr:gamma carbonic anhydrase family protein [Fulvivirgaceae bacterium BMA12]
MAILKSVKGIHPVVGNDCFIAENATIVGEVKLGKQCSVWFNAVVRGDVNSITVGDYTNIQDGAVIHCTYQKAKTIIGNQVSIGHNAIVHGCTVEDNALIGMGAIVMDHAHIGSYAIIAAGSVVLEGTVVESGALYAGVPAKKVKMVDEDMKLSMHTTAQNYLKYSQWFKD